MGTWLWLIVLLVIIFIIVLLIVIWYWINSNSDSLSKNLDHSNLVDPPEDNIVILRNESNEQKIPKMIYQTQEFSKVPPIMAKYMQKIKNLNPDYGYQYFDDTNSRKFLADNFKIEVLKAYDSLLPGAYRADLFRYCLLYKKGGVYLDSGFVAESKLSNHIFPEDEFVSPADLGLKMNDRIDGIYNAFIASIPNHPILKRAIEICLERIQNKDKGISTLYLTGPVSLGDAFKSVTGKEIDLLFHENGIRFLSHENYSVKSSKGKIFSTKYPNYRDEVRKYNTGEHYGVMWHKNKIFAEDVQEIPLGYVYREGCPNNIGIDPFSRSKENHIEKFSKDNRKTILRNHITERKIEKPQQKIPSVIHQTNEFSEIPERMYQHMEKISQMNPEYEMRYYTNTDRLNYLKKYFNEKVVSAYEKLKPGAFKADLFRICVIYQEGGVYLDSSFDSRTPLIELIQKDDELILCYDIKMTSIYNAFLAGTPKHKFFEKVIEEMIHRINSNYYGSDPLDVTGPKMLGTVFKTVPKDIQKHIKFIKHRIFQNGLCLTGNVESLNEKTIYFHNKYAGYSLDMAWYTKEEYYAVLWHKRQVYN